MASVHKRPCEGPGCQVEIELPADMYGPVLRGRVRRFHANACRQRAYRRRLQLKRQAA